MKVKSLSRAQFLGPHGLQPTRLLHPWDFPGKSTGVGCHCLVVRILKTENIMVVSREWGGENEELLFNGYRGTFLQESYGGWMLVMGAQ